MYINLKRQVDAVRHRVLATVDVELTRKDIQQLLTQVSDDFDRIPQRAIDFLQKEGLIDKGYQLTSKGSHTHKTGMFYSRERGIFDIWYLDNDEYLQTLPLLLHRVHEPTRGGYRKRASFYDWPEQIREPQESKLHCDDAFSVTVFPNKKPTNIKWLNIEARNGSLRTEKTSLDLRLETTLDDNELKAQFRLEGNLIVDNDGQKKQVRIERDWPAKIEANFFDDIAYCLNLKWSPTHKRMMGSVPEDTGSLLDFLKPCESLNSIKPAIDTSYGDFCQGEVRSIPLMPENRSIAQQWQRAWLAEWLREKYYTPEEVQHNQQVWLQHPAVKDYDLHALTGDNLLGALNRSKYPHSYWHAAAAQALIPDNSCLVPASITLKEGSYLDAGELLRQLTGGEQVKTLIYSDRHYKSAVHAHNMQKLAKLGGIVDGIIFSEGDSTQKPEGWQIESVKKSPAPCETRNSASTTSRPDHDRYWILITNNKPLLWKCSTSLDFIDFRKPEPRIKGSPTFTRQNTQDLPDYLQQALRNQTQANKKDEELTQ